MADDTITDADGTTDDDNATHEGELPPDLIAEAKRLTRLAREAADDAEAEAYYEDRDGRLTEHGFTARVREEDAGEVLVLHPAEWVEDGTVQFERIGDTDRAIERHLSGPGESGDFEAIDSHNREVVAEVRERTSAVHAENATAFADFMSNHYVRPVETATADEIREFLEWYFPRNAFPSEAQRDSVEESLQFVFEATDREPPTVLTSDL